MYSSADLPASRFAAPCRCRPASARPRRPPRVLQRVAGVAPADVEDLPALWRADRRGSRLPAQRLSAALASQATEVGIGLHDHLRAHDRVSRAAQLGADNRIAARLGWRDERLGEPVGHDILLDAHCGHPEGVDHVVRAQLEVQLAIDRHVQLG